LSNIKWQQLIAVNIDIPQTFCSVPHSLKKALDYVSDCQLESACNDVIYVHSPI